MEPQNGDPSFKKGDSPLSFKKSTSLLISQKQSHRKGSELTIFVNDSLENVDKTWQGTKIIKHVH